MMYRKFTIMITIFIVVVIGLSVALIYPPFKDIKMISAEITTEKGKILFWGEQERAFAEFQKKYDSYRPNLELVDRLFVDKENPIQVIEFIENAAARAGAQVDITLSSSVDKKATTESVPVMTFNVAAKGGFSSLGRFSKNVETGPYLITIKRAAIVADEASPGQLEADFIFLVIAK